MYYVPNALLSTFHTSCEVVLVVIPILLMGQLRLREVT